MNNPPKQTPPSSLYPCFIYAVMFVVFLFLFFSYFAFSHHMALSKLLEFIFYSIYIPHFNSCDIGTINNINILVLYNFFLLLTIVILIFVARIKNQKNAAPIIIRTIVILGISLFAVIQQLSRNDYFQKEKLTFSRKTVSEKYTLLADSAYTFAEQCRLNLRGKHQGSLITDQDLGKDPYSTLHRFLSYHLYPMISLRFNNNTPKDTVILFFKNNPLHSIPESYQPLVIDPAGEYVLAIEKKHE